MNTETSSDSEREQRKQDTQASPRPTGRPVRPAAADRQTRSATQEGDSPQPTRRDFMKMGVGALSGLVLLEMGGASLFFLKPRSLEGEFGGVVNAGDADSFPNGTVTEFPAGRFFLVRADDGGFLAIYRRCTHLGCAVSWEATKDHFVCPCHGSNFSMQGDVENPPAPRALDTFAVQIKDGQVLVDTARPQSRDTFQPEQIVYA